MQSAFVDLGLERDAFLYVTDFIELEDQEETDELEKAAATVRPARDKASACVPRTLLKLSTVTVDVRKTAARVPARESRSHVRTPHAEEAPVETAAPVPASVLAAEETAQDQEERGGGRWADGVAAAADADSRALRRKRPRRQSPALPVRPNRFRPLNLKRSRLRARSLLRALRRTRTRRRRPLCCRENRFRSTAARRQVRQRQRSLPAAPKLHFQTLHADRRAHYLGWQRLVAGRVDFAASRTSAGGRARFASESALRQKLAPPPNRRLRSSARHRVVLLRNGNGNGRSEGNDSRVRRGEPGRRRFQ